MGEKLYQHTYTDLRFHLLYNLYAQNISLLLLSKDTNTSLSHAQSFHMINSIKQSYGLSIRKG